MAVQLIVPTAINLLTFINETLISARRRGFDGTVTLPGLRDRARAVVYENSIMRIESSVITTSTGDYTK